MTHSSPVERAHIVLAHPETQSFNGLLASTTKRTLEEQGCTVTMSDLYAMNFDPREGAVHYSGFADPGRFHAQTEQRHHADAGTTPPDVASEIDNLLAADLLVVHFPLWWFGPPAMWKGWIDRVFVYGAMYRSQMRYDAGVCAGKQMLACVTTGASANSCAYDGREGDTRMHLWPALFPFRYVGYEVLTPEVIHGVGGVAFIEGDDDETSGVERFAANWASQVQAIGSRAAIPYNADSDFDDRHRLHPDAPAHSPFVTHDRASLWSDS